MTVLNIYVTTQLKCHVTFCVRPPHPNFAPYQVLGAIGLVKVEIKRFLFITWPRHRSVTCLCGLIHSSYIVTLLGLVSIGLIELEIMAFAVSVLIPIPIPMPRFQCRGLQMPPLVAAS